MYQDPSVRRRQREALPPLPFEVPACGSGVDAETLVIDAFRTGVRLCRAVLCRLFPAGRAAGSALLAAGQAGGRRSSYPEPSLRSTSAAAKGPAACALPSVLPAGNLARFINHSCEPNLLVQPVLRAGDSGLRYCVGLFAARWAAEGPPQPARALRCHARHKEGQGLPLRTYSQPPTHAVPACPSHRDIPCGTELCYDYNYKLNATGKVMACHCGAEKCRGRLL